MIAGLVTDRPPARVLHLGETRVVLRTTRLTATAAAPGPMRNGVQKGQEPAAALLLLPGSSDPGRRRLIPASIRTTAPRHRVARGRTETAALTIAVDRKTVADRIATAADRKTVADRKAAAAALLAA